LSARENLEFFATLQGIPESDVSRRVDEMLEFFELTSRAKDKVETFSKGNEATARVGARVDPQASAVVFG
jgi:ABC-2 type transport system ATP-binding protein